MLSVLPYSRGYRFIYLPGATENSLSASTPNYQKQRPPVSPAFYTTCLTGPKNQLVSQGNPLLFVLKTDVQARTICHLNCSHTSLLSGYKAEVLKGQFNSSCWIRASSPSPTEHGRKLLVRPAAIWVMPSSWDLLGKLCLPQRSGTEALLLQGWWPCHAFQMQTERTGAVFQPHFMARSHCDSFGEADVLPLI